MRIVLVLLLLLPIAMATGLREPARADARCSMIPVPTSRSPAQTRILGTATPDTLHTGVGTVNLDHIGSAPRTVAPPRPIHGQVVRVELFGGADSALIARTFDARGRRDVLLVPWSYDSACRPIPWGLSARWSPIGLEGAFTVTPRPSDQWVEGHPTFDVFAANMQPYPHGEFLRRGYGGMDRLHTEPSLSAREFFDLYRILPTVAEARNPEVVRAAIARWELEHPSARDRFPAREIFGFVRRVAGID